MRSLAALLVVLTLAGCPESTPPLPIPDADADSGRADGGPPRPEAGPEIVRVDRPPGPEAGPEVGREVPSPQERPEGASPGSGLDRGRRVASLSDAELGRLCDWGVGLLGGYGTVMRCSDGSQISNSPSRQACIAGHDRSSRCIASVGDSEDCLLAIARNGCSQALFQIPACQAMFTCQRA